MGRIGDGRARRDVFGALAGGVEAGATLLARPAGEPLWEAIADAMLAHYEGAGTAPDAVAQAEGLISFPGSPD